VSETPGARRSCLGTSWGRTRTSKLLRWRCTRASSSSSSPPTRHTSTSRSTRCHLYLTRCGRWACSISSRRPPRRLCKEKIVVWAVCSASEHCSSKQITIKSPQYARLEGVPYSSGRPAPDGMWLGFKCKAGWKVQQWGMTTRGWRIDRYNVPVTPGPRHPLSLWCRVCGAHAQI